MPSVKISVSVPLPLFYRLERLAAETGQSKPKVILTAVEAYCEREHPLTEAEAVEIFNRGNSEEITERIAIMAAKHKANEIEGHTLFEALDIWNNNPGLLTKHPWVGQMIAIACEENEWEYWQLPDIFSNMEAEKAASE